MSKWDPAFAPKSGNVLKVVMICRISTLLQDTRSLADQEALYRKWLEEHVEIPWTCEVIAGQGSGENLERAAYLDLIERTAEFDLVLTEDLGRICRRVHAHIFCENAVDVQTRVIAINDHLDTAKDGWEMSSYFAVMRHETYNKDTSKRIRRSLRNRFSQGGVVQCFPYGYIKPHPKAADSDCFKDASAEPIYKEWFERLEEGQSYAEISDWLVANNIPVGPYVRRDKWTPELVAQVTHNPILKGERRRNVRMSDRVNKSGRKKSIKAPASELLIRHCPHLAFFDPAYYDGMIAMLRLRNGKYRRGKDGTDCRRNVPRGRTRWPGQHLRCGICGRKFVFGGHGQKDHLMCDGARHHLCWNSVTCDGPLAVSKVLAAILGEVERLEGFDETFRCLVIEEAQAGVKEMAEEIARVDSQQRSLARSIDNYTKAIGELGMSSALLNSLREAETRLTDLNFRRQGLKKAQLAKIPAMPTADELRTLANEAFLDIDVGTPEFARLMRELISDIHVYPFRLIDGGLPVLRAKLSLNLMAFMPSKSRLPGPALSFERMLVVDFFKKPDRERHRPEVVAGMQIEGTTFKDMAEKLEIFPSVAQRAGQIKRLMDSAGVSDPYLPIRAPIEGNSKYRRHHHPRFHFEPLSGYERPDFPEI
ncbi:MAG: Recombinase [Schlesneria sp.]|nr:Recombinase [Schlesneria sp.]